MKNTDQIRQLICEIYAIADNDEPKPLPGESLACFPRIMDLVDKALTLLPCERCGGTNGVHKQVDDPQAGNSHMLTKMQCPLDK